MSGSVVKILVTLAVDAEFAPWRKIRKFELVRAGAITLRRTQIAQVTADFVITGMGQENARRVSSEVMAAPYTMCIASGFAGALKEHQNVGDIVVARTVQQLGTSVSLQCSPQLFRSAIEAQSIGADVLLTTDKLAGTAAEKKQLGRFADVIDMESFAVLSVASERGVPAIAIRAISDRVDEDIPAGIETTVDETGRVRASGVARYLGTHPLRVQALIRIGKNSRAAAQSLVKFLEAYITKLSLSGPHQSDAELMEISAT